MIPKNCAVLEVRDTDVYIYIPIINGSPTHETICSDIYTENDLLGDSFIPVISRVKSFFNGSLTHEPFVQIYRASIIVRNAGIKRLYQSSHE